jgi:hypothetical protein
MGKNNLVKLSRSGTSKSENWRLWANPLGVQISKKPVFWIPITSVACIGLAGWCFQNFLQTRGVVSNYGSRFFLSITCLALLVWVWAIALSLPLLRRAKISIAVICTVLLIAGSLLLDKITLREPQATVIAPDTRLTPEIAKDLESIKTLIGNKNEDALQNLFAFREMEEMNAIYVGYVIARTSRNNNLEREHPDPFSGMGVVTLFSTEIGQLYEKGGGHIYDPLSDKNISSIALHPRYVASKKTLDDLRNSIDLPPDVHDALVDFDNEVQANANGLIEFLNNIRHKDLNYFLKYNDVKTGYWRMLDKMYFEDRFIPLKPKADVLMRTTKAALGEK